MLGAAIIVFREVLEAGLIIGIVAAVTRGVAGRNLWISGGVCLGIAGAGLLALFVQALSAAFEGAGQDVFNAGILGIAALMLLWHNVWMAQHGRETAAALQKAGEAVASRQAGLASLGIVVAVAVLREGAEVVLFLYGLAAGGDEGWLTIALGSLGGLVAGAMAGVAIFAGLVALPVKTLFKATTVIIALLAAGMAAQSVGFLQQAGLLVQGAPVWDSSGLLDEKSLAGRVLHTLVGYIDQPTLMQCIAYALVLLLNIALTRRLNVRQAAIAK